MAHNIRVLSMTANTANVAIGRGHLWGVQLAAGTGVGGAIVYDEVALANTVVDQLAAVANTTAGGMYKEPVAFYKGLSVQVSGTPVRVVVWFESAAS